MMVQWNLCDPTPEFSDILCHLTKIYGPKVFLLTKIKPEYSDILQNPTHFPSPVVCQIRQVPLYLRYQANFGYIILSYCMITTGTVATEAEADFSDIADLMDEDDDGLLPYA